VRFFKLEHTMPLVRIDLPTSTSAAHRAAVSDAVHQAMVETFNVPLADRFQTITRRAHDELICTPEFLGVSHSEHVVLVQITCSPGRTLDAKKALYALIVQRIASTSEFMANDVIINLVETVRENWSFGNGIAHYAV
jgi:4-oxalocrotonate tautomerase